MTHSHDGPFFTATLMKLNVMRDESPAFNLFQAQLSGVNVTTITGDRRLVQSGDAAVEGSLRVGGGRSRSTDTLKNVNVRHSLFFACTLILCDNQSFFTVAQ